MSPRVPVVTPQGDQIYVASPEYLETKRLRELLELPGRVTLYDVRRMAAELLERRKDK